MKQFNALSIGTKILVAFEGLLMLAVAIITIIGVIVSPIWDRSVLDGIFWTTIVLFTIGMVEWFFITIMLDIIFDK